MGREYNIGYKMVGLVTGYSKGFSNGYLVGPKEVLLTIALVVIILLLYQANEQPEIFKFEDFTCVYFDGELNCHSIKVIFKEQPNEI